jgi:hypothetical protein
VRFLGTVFVLAGVVTSLDASAVPRPAPGDPAYWPRVAQLERSIAADPEDLRAEAEYRQLLIEGRYFDRSIDFFEKLARRRAAGANLHLTLALAFVDKVPTSGDVRRAYLGRDAINEATKSLDCQPTVLAYYIRGFINLHFDNMIFHRADKGIADLMQARALTTDQTPVALAARVWVTLGDAYWRQHAPAKARAIWMEAARKYASDPELRKRTDNADAEVARIIDQMFALSTRVDTSLEGALE